MDHCPILYKKPNYKSVFYCLKEKIYLCQSSWKIILEGKLNTIVKTIKMLNGKVRYIFLRNAQYENFHKELFQLNVVKIAHKCKPMKGQFWNISVLLSNRWTN